MGRRSSIRLLSFFAVCFAFKGQATTIPDIVAKAKPAVVQVIASDSIWDTRVQDFEAFVSNSGYDATGGMLSIAKGREWGDYGATWKAPGFAQGPTHQLWE